MSHTVHVPVIAVAVAAAAAVVVERVCGNMLSRG
jgi:hypothetical protein